MAIIDTLILFILHWSGWIKKLATEYRVTNHTLNLYLLLLIGLSLLPPWMITSQIGLSPLLLGIVLAVVYLWGRMPEKDQFALWTLIIVLSSFFLLLHEWLAVHANWHHGLFINLVGGVLFVSTQLGCSSLSAKTIVFWGSLLIFYCMLLYFDQQRFRPLVIGEDAFLSLCLLLFLGQIFLHQIWISKQQTSLFIDKS
jgi:hypothetical protein